LVDLKLLSADLMARGYSVRLPATGGSMFPVIWTGDTLTVSPTTHIAPRDIVVFWRERQMVCHTVVRVFERDGREYCQTRGDSSLELDEPVPLERVLGKVTEIELGSVPFSRRILLLLSPILRRRRLNAFAVAMVATISKRIRGDTRRACRRPAQFPALTDPGAMVDSLTEFQPASEAAVQQRG
jgi:hypothetical protein